MGAMWLGMYVTGSAGLHHRSPNEGKKPTLLF